MIFIQNLLSTLNKIIKEFSYKLMTFLVYKIFQKMRLIIIIIFKIKNVVNILSALIINNDNRFSELNMLIK